ncbi:c-5 sterol desaturase [Ranunculus cassubicifolius]
MPRGTLQVLLVGAKGLENTDFLCNMDPYAVLKYRSHEQKSTVASGKGSDPEWNETFVFNINGSDSTLDIKLYDSDSGSGDDFVGEASIPLDTIFEEGSLPATSFNVCKEQEYCGEIRLSLTFTPAAEDAYTEREQESYGGWKHSEY